MNKDLQLLIQKYERLLNHGKANTKLADKNNPIFHPRCQKAINTIWNIIIKDLQVLADKQLDDKSKNK